MAALRPLPSYWLSGLSSPCPMPPVRSGDAFRIFESYHKPLAIEAPFLKLAHPPLFPTSANLALQVKQLIGCNRENLIPLSDAQVLLLPQPETLLRLRAIALQCETAIVQQPKNLPSRATVLMNISPAERKKVSSHVERK